MPDFKYRAVLRNGKIVRNIIQAKTKSEVINKLKNTKMTPISITAKKIKRPAVNKKQIDLLIKSAYIAQCNIKREDPDLNLLFEDKEHDYDLLYILQRLIGATANKQIYNIIDSSFFIKDREQFYINNEKTIDKKKVV